MEKDSKFIEYLSGRLKEKLPGAEAHRLMMPGLEKMPDRTIPLKKTIKKSAVLLLLYPNGNGLNILLTLRSRNLASHSGQISFPGGHLEKGEGVVQAALREAWEEIGLESGKVTVVGNLSDLYVPPSNFVITPVVGFSPEKPHCFIHSRDEVEEIIDLPLETFTNGTHYGVEKWNFKGMELDVPVWRIHSLTPLWGATSMILKELLVLWEEYKSGVSR